MSKKNIAIAGSHGFIGSHLVNELKKSYNIIRISTKDLYDTVKLYNTIKNVDILINVAGVPIFKLWTKKNKKQMYDSRVIPARNFVSCLNKMEKSVHFINISAVGIYKPDRCYHEENGKYGNNFLAKILIDTENELNNLGKNHKFAVSRMGIVMGNEGYLKKVLPSFKMGVNVTFGSGKQFFSYIHIKDAVRAYTHILKEELTGIFNFSSPEKLSMQKANNIIGEVYHAPVKINVPESLLKLIIGNQRVIFTETPCVEPKRLLESSFEFQYTEFEEVIRLNKKTN